jgi:hypothetical protein
MAARSAAEVSETRWSVTTDTACRNAPVGTIVMTKLYSVASVHPGCAHRRRGGGQHLSHAGSESWRRRLKWARSAQAQLPGKIVGRC